jgi:hypothetical protein
MRRRKRKTVDTIKLARTEYEVGLRDDEPIISSFHCEHRGCPHLEVVDHELHCPIDAYEDCWHSKQMLKQASSDAVCPICSGKHAAFVCRHSSARDMLRETERTTHYTPDANTSGSYEKTLRPIYSTLERMYG